MPVVLKSPESASAKAFQQLADALQLILKLKAS